MTGDAPYFQDVADGPPATATWVHAADDVRLRVACWHGGQAGTVLVFPGRTEFVEKYARTAGELLDMGFSSAAIDWRGQGLADRTLDDQRVGHVVEFADYQLDVDAMLTHVRAAGLPEPYYLLGHSMGGAIGLRALYEGLPVACAAFTGPMWGVKISPVLRPIAWALTYAVRFLGLGGLFAPTTGPGTYVSEKPFEDNVLTSDPGMWAYMRNQLAVHPELRLGGPSIHWVYEALVECAHLARRPAPDVPAVTYLGTRERVVDTARIKSRMAGWPNGRLELIPECEHEVLMETPEIRARVMADMASHFRTCPIEARARGAA